MPDFQTQLSSAPVIFIGTVRTVENGLAVFHVEKQLKGHTDAATFEVDEMLNTCGIRFAAGQRWFYMGKMAASGSLLLMSETGHLMADHISFVKKHFGADVLAPKDDLRGGTIKASCAPWDGAAFSIQLDNGIHAAVYVRLPETGQASGTVYPADGKIEAGHASIMYCPPKGKEQATKAVPPCQTFKGTVTLGNVEADTANGQIETQAPDSEYHSRFVFKVKRLKTHAVCG